MTHDEIMKTMDDLCNDGKSWIEVVGGNAEDIASKIAARYDTEARGPIIVANKSIDCDFCYDEENLEATCENLRAEGIMVWPENFEF